MKNRDEQFSDAETQRRLDRGLKRAFKMPPPHKAKARKPKTSTRKRLKKA